MQSLPSVFIIAHQLWHHHDFVPVIGNLDRLDGLVLEDLECEFHDLDPHILKDNVGEVGLFGSFLLEDHRRVLLVEYFS